MVPLIAQSGQEFDAQFGSRLKSDDPITVKDDLRPGMDQLMIGIINDLIPEERECFTIHTFPVDVPGRRELFTCNEDDVGEKNYSCEHTICICDDDGYNDGCINT